MYDMIGELISHGDQFETFLTLCRIFHAINEYSFTNDCGFGALGGSADVLRNNPHSF